MRDSNNTESGSRKSRETGEETHMNSGAETEELRVKHRQKRAAIMFIMLDPDVKALSLRFQCVNQL